MLTMFISQTVKYSVGSVAYRLWVTALHVLIQIGQENGAIPRYLFTLKFGKTLSANLIIFFSQDVKKQYFSSFLVFGTRLDISDYYQSYTFSSFIK